MSFENKPRIALFLATSGHSGVDKIARNLVPALARRGYQVDILKIQEHGPHLEELPPGVRIIDLGTSHVYSAIPAIVRYLKRERPAVLLADKYRVIHTAYFAKILSGVPVRLIFSMGATISIDLAGRSAFERWYQRQFIKHFYPRADKVIVTSKGVADDMAAYGRIARSCIEVVPCPVIATELLQTRPQRPEHPWFQAGEPPVILGVGELSKRKDFATLIRAFALVRAERPCRLVILGRGRQHDHLIALAGELGVGDDVDLAGFQPNPYAFMAYAALFAFTSQHEGLGFVVIEALAVGTPVVSTDCPSGPREILRDGKYGELVPVGAVVALAGAIAKTLDAPRRDPDFLRQAALPYEIECSTDAYLRVFEVGPGN
ncbi:MAG: glycosyltransferase [Desulfuromonadales bacterium]|nr:glycosyltransferase [Desulfuromonadales bacterium]